jgi:hypothetical protein
MGIYIAYVFACRATALCKKKKYLLLKRITVQSRGKTPLCNIKSERPILLLAEGSPANMKHRTTMHPPAFSPIKNEALPTPWLG